MITLPAGVKYDLVTYVKLQERSDGVSWFTKRCKKMIWQVDTISQRHLWKLSRAFSISLGQKSRKSKHKMSTQHSQSMEKSATTAETSLPTDRI